MAASKFIPAAEISEDISRRMRHQHNNSTDQVINLTALEMLPSRAVDT